MTEVNSWPEDRHVAHWPVERQYVKHMVAPILLASFPVLFLYHHNARILVLSSLWPPLGLCVLVSLAVYSLFYAASRWNSLASANSALAFLVFFFLYGTLYRVLLDKDLIPIDHYRLLPIVVIVGMYAAYFIAKLPEESARNLHRVATLLAGGLVVYNLVGIVAIEAQKARISHPSGGQGPTVTAEGEITRRPDIYYIVLDEFAGLDVAKQYFGYDEIDQFEGYLEDQGFFVSNGSRSRTLDSLTETASRLNFEEYPVDLGPMAFYDLISRNRVMDEIRAFGYTTVVFDGMRSPLSYPSKSPIVADHQLAYRLDSANLMRVGLDEFAGMVRDLTMLMPLSALQESGAATRHAREVLFGFERVGSLDDIPSPKFVYAHMMIPHEPWVFDANGGTIEPECYSWDCYLGSYIFTLRLVRGLVETVQGSADQDNPPIIILQSDHGARNISYMNGGVLPNYPLDYRNHILNALYLPGFDYSSLTEDLDPIMTFPLILDHYFGQDIPLQ